MRKVSPEIKPLHLRYLETKRKGKAKRPIFSGKLRDGGINLDGKLWLIPRCILDGGF